MSKSTSALTSTPVRILTGASLLAATVLTGCPDPQGQYEAFQERREEALALVEETGGAGTDANPNAIPVLTELPQTTSGRFVFGLAPNLNLERPMVFVADVEIEIDADQSAGRVISMTLDPRTCEDRNVSAGDAVVFMPDEAAEIAPEMGFSADFGNQVVPGTANCISGSRIQAEIVLDGQVTSEDTLCGLMNGALILPYEADLEGSTFGARRLAEGEEADLSMIDVLKDCAGVAAYLEEE